MEIRTERLVLRRAVPNDAESMFCYLGDPTLTTYLAHPPLTLGQTRKRLARATAPVDGPRFDLLLAMTHPDGTVIGEVHAWNVTEDGLPTSQEPGEVWLAYAVHPAHQGNGYATEAVRGLLPYLRSREIARVFANMFEVNAASRNLLDRLGFEEHLRFPAELDSTGKGLASIRMVLELGLAKC
ncbi:GNAT family N-acetyltransferase [Nocardia sp. NPDC051052]|uniref:GNAT family N-acetyltransferase n=1 Tax=Nocardia sp. NPDC051052 TaxID=3364322 RepID=UPI003788C234